MLRKINKNSIALMDQAVFSGGSFIVTLLLARVLSVEDFGVFSSILIFNYAVISILTSVIIQPFQVSLAKIEDKKTYMSFTFWLQIIGVILVIIVSQLIINFDFKVLEKLKVIGTNSLLFFTGFVVHDYFRKVFLARNETYKALIIDVLNVGTTILALGSIWLFYENTRFNIVILILSLTYLLPVILGFILLKPNYKNIKSYKEYILIHTQQGKWLLLTTITQWWSSNLFIVASGIYLGVKALGAFRLVQSLFGILNLILQTFENYILPQASLKYAQSEALAKRYLIAVSKKSGALFFSLLVLLFIFSEQTILLVGGEDYKPYSFIIKGMCILYAIIFIGYPIRLSIRMLVLNRVFFIGSLFSLLVSALTFNYLLAHFQIIGAIIGLTVSQVITMVYWQTILVKNKFILWK
jgi:O-antigen/teichoic acid export membrane protein